MNSFFESTLKCQHNILQAHKQEFTFSHALFTTHLQLLSWPPHSYHIWLPLRIFFFFFFTFILLTIITFLLHRKAVQEAWLMIQTCPLVRDPNPRTHHNRGPLVLRAGSTPRPPDSQHLSPPLLYTFRNSYQLFKQKLLPHVPYCLLPSSPH